jgi:hypothetical protein
MPKRPYQPHHQNAVNRPTQRMHGSYIQFNMDYFLNDLGKVTEIAIKRVAGIVVGKAKQNIATMRFTYFPVRLAGEAVPKAGLRKTTSGYGRTDASRKHALLSSLVIDKVVKTSNTKMNVMVQTMASNFKDSHIGIYYEHGTGKHLGSNGGAWDFTLVKGSKYEHNPLRRGTDIYTRPGQEWTDLGGNKRISHAGKLQKLNGFSIPAYHWFARAVEYANSQFNQVFNEEFSTLHINKYLQIKPNIVIGGRKK